MILRCNSIYTQIVIACSNTSGRRKKRIQKEAKKKKKNENWKPLFVLCKSENWKSLFILCNNRQFRSYPVPSLQFVLAIYLYSSDLYGSIWCCISTRMLSFAVSVSLNKNEQNKGNSSLFTLCSFRFCNSIYTRSA